MPYAKSLSAPIPYRSQHNCAGKKNSSCALAQTRPCTCLLWKKFVASAWDQGILIADAQRSAAQGFPGALALALSHLRSASYSLEAAATSVTRAASTAAGAGLFTASASTALAVRRNTAQLGTDSRDWQRRQACMGHRRDWQRRQACTGHRRAGTYPDSPSLR